MFLPRFPLVLCVLIFAVGVARAQDAQAIIDAAAKVYTDAQAYSVQVDSRTLQFAFAPSQPGAEPRYDVPSTQYSRIQIKVRRPMGYWLSVQSAGQGGPMIPARGGMGEVRMMGGSSASILARTDNGQAKRGMYQGGKFTVQDISETVFNSMAVSLLGFRSGEDVVLRHFNPQSAPGGNMALGLIEPDLIGREASNGRRIYRLVAKTSGGSPVMLWIDQESSQIVRSIVQRSAGGAAQAGRHVSVIETLYNYQQMNPAFSSSDFVLTASVPLERLVPEQMGFIPVADLVKLADIAPAAGAGGVAGAPGTEPAAPVAATPAPVEPAAPDAKAAEGQALSYEQMSGIVLIEGDGGTATGFITKIRDVDFVVTNLHVLGGNKKMTMKTLRGEEIPMLGVFGAAGSDIAIIRIGKGQGELKLAEDVFKTSKIGDKVVVVGNRQGGGVATQVAGSIVGVGPTRVEVNANFEPGNSGSPIVNLGTGEVVGVASYSETRQVSVEEHAGQPAATPRTRAVPTPVTVEKRWFGYRLDSVAKWEAIDLAKWNAQEERIEKFTEMSEALVAVLRLDFNKARQHPRLSSLITSFETRMRSTSGTGVAAATEVKDLFRVIRTISEDGVNDLKNGDYYDYYRTCLYWETSIPAQLEYRKAIIDVLKKYEANSAGYLSRMRGGS